MAIKMKANGQATVPLKAESKYDTLVSTPAKAFVEVAKSHKGKTLSEDHATETVHSGISTSGHPALVFVEASQTVNTGNYNSVKVVVGLTMPCGMGDIEATYEFVSKWVSQKMEENTKGVIGGDK